ncbi:1,4-dihydroxy-2-naphthoate octaprenyltransferase [Micractinium conductrix]|uniref:1,4-dihydroxy-2-naphthoate octaprenyltransferase n=1 Tax=Micractinium conductrix TaxID=554055 RepID=A0A2P6VB61_9CHLO|nr:1,4-dihydroxy-2-naphthoate octaprenyltransferase [Micractinium conductrix]|eukprot:PSC71337.1 1,4-dihydroxy-2-naphthoate octaprenyltransferase [Micractinium conductrix]
MFDAAAVTRGFGTCYDGLRRAHHGEGFEGTILGICAGLGVKPGQYTLPDKITTAVVAACTVVYFLILFWMTVYIKVEAYFNKTPWLRYTRKMQVSEHGRKYDTRCPFTGNLPSMRCPSCECRVHETAFHKRDRLVVWAFGETVLRWDIARDATELAGDKASSLPACLAKLRRRMDAALEYRGNTVFGTLTACCSGCATWQRCFNLLPRMSLGLALSGMFFAFVPWAFASFLSGDTDGGHSPIGGGGAKTIHTISNILAVSNAVGAVLVQTFALLRANDFLDTYRPMMPALQPLFRTFKSPFLRGLLRAPWEQAV